MIACWCRLSREMGPPSQLGYWSTSWASASRLGLLSRRSFHRSSSSSGRLRPQRKKSSLRPRTQRAACNSARRSCLGLEVSFPLHAAERGVRRTPPSLCSSYHAYIWLHPVQCRPQETRCARRKRLRRERHARKVRPAHPSGDSQTLDSSPLTTDSPNAYRRTPVEPLVACSVRIPRVLVKQSTWRA